MAIRDLFKPGAPSLLDRIQSRDWKTPEEKAALLAELLESRQLKTAEAVRLLYTTDGEIRRTAARLLGARRDPETVRLALQAQAGRPEAARRAAFVELAGQPGLALVARLGELMEGGDGALCRLAMEALLEVGGGREVLGLLLKIAEQGEAPQRLRAVSRLAEGAELRDAALFEKLAHDGDERIRFVAYQTLARFSSARHLELFLRRLPEEPYTTQQLLVEAAERLLPQAPPEAQEAVLELVASGSTQLRSAAIRILLALPDRPGTVRRFIAFSRQLAGWVRERALHSLREFGEQVLEPALELVASGDPEMRSAAFALVQGFPSPRVTEAAVPLLEDPDWWIAIQAAEVLGRDRSQGSVGALIAALGREEVRWAAVEALGRIGGEAAIQALAEGARDERTEVRIEALSALAMTRDRRAVPVLRRAAASDPAKWVRSRAEELLERLQGETGGFEAAGQDGPSSSGWLAIQESAPEVHHMLAFARREGASDLHVSVDAPPTLRVFGHLRRLEVEPLLPEETEALLLPLLGAEERARLGAERQLDACFFVENDGRYRGNLFRDRKGLNGVFRVIPERPPTIYQLGLPADLAEIAQLHQGIVIVTGPSGCGKSTTLAALVDLFNETRRAHVLTLEDPVEFVHPFKNCLVNQRDVGKHTRSFARALRAALREDPDVIVIGELRDPETVSLALTAAETGHVVLTTLNATTAPKAVDRIIGSFAAGEQSQVRESFAGSLKLVVAQTLVPGRDGGRVGCYEVLKGTPAVVNLIRDNKTYQIPSQMQIGQGQGMRRFDDALLELVRSAKVSPETAYLRASSKEAFEPLVSPKFLEEVLA